MWLMQLRSSRRLKFCFVQGLTLVRVPLIFLFLAVSVFCRYPAPEFCSWYFAAMMLGRHRSVRRLFRPQVPGDVPPGSYADPMTTRCSI
jgi:hypothetical protein